MGLLVLIFGIILPVVMTPSVVAISMTRPEWDEIAVGTVLVVYAIGGFVWAFA